MRIHEELVPGSKLNHHEPVTVRDEVTGKGELILGSPLFSSLSPHERKESKKIEQEQKEKKIFPKSTVVHEIHSDDEANEVPIFSKEKPDSISRKKK